YKYTCTYYIYTLYLHDALPIYYFLERIQEEFPNEKLIGYFYDPNIHPYSEYRLRYLDVEYSCKKLGITLIEGPYNLEEWLKKVKDRKSTRLNSSHVKISYAVFC